MMLMLAVAFVSWMSWLMPLWAARKSWKSDRLVRWIAILAAFSFLADLAVFAMALSGINNYPVGNAYLLVQSLVFLMIYQDALKMRPAITYLLGGAYTVAFVANYFFVQGPYVVNSYSIVLSSVGFILFSLIYFRQLLINLPETFVHRVPMVWVNSSVLIYFSGNLFTFMLFNYLMSSIWILHNILNIIKNILLFVAVWQSQRTTTSSSS